MIPSSHHLNQEVLPRDYAKTDAVNFDQVSVKRHRNFFDRKDSLDYTLKRGLHIVALVSCGISTKRFEVRGVRSCQHMT